MLKETSFNLSTDIGPSFKYEEVWARKGYILVDGNIMKVIADSGNIMAIVHYISSTKQMSNSDAIDLPKSNSITEQSSSDGGYGPEASVEASSERSPEVD